MLSTSISPINELGISSVARVCVRVSDKKASRRGPELLWWIKRLSLDGILELMVALEIFDQYGRTHVRLLPSLRAYIKTPCGLRSLNTVSTQHLSEGKERHPMPVGEDEEVWNCHQGFGSHLGNESSSDNPRERKRQTGFGWQPGIV
uniref:Uncharacterized protein n=1 Tax=Tanacetum cinerariifolium TaxID=118510 RepID=A0A6L2K7K6_TANCI|nr:hypothetical protein [Tanacetum cinerariifolium]